MKEIKTKLSNEIMSKISDIIEEKFKKSNIFYLREETRFSTTPDNIDKLLEFQYEANLELIEKGIITQEMLMKDINDNFN